MKQIPINGRVLGIVDVPEDIGKCRIVEYKDGLYLELKGIYLRLKLLPLGNWSILGRLNDITEEQAAGLVEEEQGFKHKLLKSETEYLKTKP